MPPTASRRRRWWSPTRSLPSVSASSTNGSAPRPLPSSTSRAGSSMSACSGTIGSASCRSGSSSSEAWHMAQDSSPRNGSSTTPNIRSAAAPAKDLSPELSARIERSAKRIYRTLELDGYARIDFRLSADGIPYYIETNPNPEIARAEEFASAALHDGVAYAELLHRILALGIRRAGSAEPG